MVRPEGEADSIDLHVLPQFLSDQLDRISNDLRVSKVKYSVLPLALIVLGRHRVDHNSAPAVPVCPHHHVLDEIGLRAAGSPGHHQYDTFRIVFQGHVNRKVPVLPLCLDKVPFVSDLSFYRVFDAFEHGEKG